MDRAYSRGVLPSIDGYFSVKTRPGSVTMEVATETRNSSSMQTAKYLLVTFSYNSVSDMYEWYNLIVKYPISAKNDVQDMPPLAPA